MQGTAPPAAFLRPLPLLFLLHCIATYIHNVITYSGKCIVSWMCTSQCCIFVCHMSRWIGSEPHACIWWDCEGYFLRFPECVKPAAAFWETNTFWETHCISANYVSTPRVLLMGPIFNVSDLLAFLSFRCDRLGASIPNTPTGFHPKNPVISSYR